MATGRIIAATNDVAGILPAWCRWRRSATGVRLFEVQPTDESLSSVFSYLVEK